MKILVGSKNPVKILAAQEVFEKYFTDVKVTGFQISSGVSDQPINNETFKGAENRAVELKKINDKKNINADYFVGIEGGITKQHNRWFAFGGMCIIDKDNKKAYGSSPQFELPDFVIEQLLNGVELGDVMDKLINTTNSKHKSGAIGFFTNNIITKIANVGYRYNLAGETLVKSFKSTHFRERYTKISRKTNEIQSSYLSNNKNKIEYFELKNSESLYNLLVNTLCEKTSQQFIEGNIDRIDLEKKAIYCDSETYEYDNLINTISLSQFLKLSKQIDIFKLRVINKNFYYCRLIEPDDIILSKQFMYIYSIIDNYTRKTYKKNYVIFESPEKMINFHGNVLVDKKENLKIQIQEPKNVNIYKDVTMLGRYAQWNHKIKINEIISRVIGWRDNE